MAARRKKAPKVSSARAPKPSGAGIGSEAWKQEVKKARARILGGRPADPDKTLERVAGLVERHDDAARRGDTAECEKIRRWLTDRTARDENWSVEPDVGGGFSWDAAQLAVLMDIRRRLDKIADRLPVKGEVRP